MAECREDGAEVVETAMCTERVVDTCDTCTICGLEFTNEDMKVRHCNEFIPIFSTDEKVENSEAELLPHSCSKCDKRFRDVRAQKQHENFCSGARTGRKNKVE